MKNCVEIICREDGKNEMLNYRKEGFKKIY